LLEKILEVRKKLNPHSVGEMDLSVLERFTPEIRVSMASEMDYFSIVELQKECLETLNCLERFVEDALSSEKAAFSELDLRFASATGKARSAVKSYSFADEKLAQIASVTSSGDVQGIFAIVGEVSRLKRKWFEEYSVTEIELENLEAACRRAHETIAEFSKPPIHAAIPKSKPLKVELISDSGRVCPDCQNDNPMEAVVCESCDALLPGTRRLTPLVTTRERTKPVPHVQDGVVSRQLSYGRVSVVIGAAVVVLAVAALLLVPRSPKVAAAEVPVVDRAVVTKDALLGTSPGVEAKAIPVPKREAAAVPLQPKSTLPAPAPAPVKGESVEAAEKLLSQGKTGLENAETRAQLNVVIADMNAIVNMTFAERRGQAIQAEARQIKDKAANSLALVK